jgi:hypothetical protein
MGIEDLIIVTMRKILGIKANITPNAAINKVRRLLRESKATLNVHQTLLQITVTVSPEHASSGSPRVNPAPNPVPGQRKRNKPPYRFFFDALTGELNWTDPRHKAVGYFPEASLDDFKRETYALLTNQEFYTVATTGRESITQQLPPVLRDFLLTYSTVNYPFTSISAQWLTEQSIATGRVKVGECSGYDIVVLPPDEDIYETSGSEIHPGRDWSAQSIFHYICGKYRIICGFDE